MPRSVRTLATVLTLVMLPVLAESAHADESPEEIRAALVKAFERHPQIHHAWQVEKGEGDEVVHVEFFREGELCGISVSGGEVNDAKFFTDGRLMVGGQRREDGLPGYFLVAGPKLLNDRNARWNAALQMTETLWGYRVAPLGSWHTAVTLSLTEQDAIALRLNSVEEDRPTASWLRAELFDGGTVTIDAANDVVVLAHGQTRISLRRADGTPREIRVAKNDGELIRSVSPVEPRRSAEAWKSEIHTACDATSIPRVESSYTQEMSVTLDTVGLVSMIGKVIEADRNLPRRAARLHSVVAVLVAASFGNDEMESWLRECRAWAREQGVGIDDTVKGVAETVWATLQPALAASLGANEVGEVHRKAVEDSVWNAVWNLIRAGISK